MKQLKTLSIFMLVALMAAAQYATPAGSGRLGLGDGGRKGIVFMIKKV